MAGVRIPAGGDKCPICGKLFREDACPHSVNDVIQHQDDLRIMALVDKRLKQLGLI